MTVIAGLWRVSFPVNSNHITWKQYTDQFADRCYTITSSAWAFDNRPPVVGLIWQRCMRNRYSGRRIYLSWVRIQCIINIISGRLRVKEGKSRKIRDSPNKKSATVACPWLSDIFDCYLSNFCAVVPTCTSPAFKVHDMVNTPELYRRTHVRREDGIRLGDGISRGVRQE
jgi:hypothetical protein